MNFFINRNLDERSFLSVQDNRITIYQKLAGKYLKAHDWYLPSLLPQLNASIQHTSATKKYVVMFAAGTKKRSGYLIALHIRSGLLRAHPLPLITKIINSFVQEGDSLEVRAVDLQGSLINVHMQPESLDLRGPIDVTPNNIIGEVIKAEILPFSTDGLVHALLAKELLIISQVIPSSQVTRTHQLENIKDLLRLWEAPLHFFLLAKDTEGHLLLAQFSKDTFELLNSWTLFSLSEGSFTHAHVLEEKVILVTAGGSRVSVYILDLTTMNVLNLISEDSFHSDSVSDCVITKGLNIFFLEASGSVLFYPGLAARNMWKTQSLKDQFDFNHWFNVLCPLMPLNVVAIDCFPWTTTLAFTSWNELRTAVDALIAQENFKAIALLVKLSDGNFEKFSKKFSLVRADMLELLLVASIHEGTPLTPLLPVVPWAWFPAIFKAIKDQSQVTELANYLLFSGVPANNETAKILLASDLEPELILEYAKKQKCLPLCINALPSQVVLNAIFTQKELSLILPIVSPQIRFFLLFNRYLYSEALYSFQQQASKDLEFYVANLLKAIPDLQAKPLALPQQYPELPQFTLSSPQSPAAVVTLKKESRKNIVTFAPSPHRDSIKSPPLHPQPYISSKNVSLSPSKFPVRLATPRHHAAIQPSRLSQHTPALIEEVSSTSSSPSRRRQQQSSPLIVKSSSKSEVEEKKEEDVGFIEKDVLESPRKHKAPEYYSPQSSTKKRKQTPQSKEKPSPRRRIFEEEDEEKGSIVSTIPTPTHVTKRKRTVKSTMFTTTPLKSSPRKTPSTPKQQSTKVQHEKAQEDVRQSPRLAAKKK